MRKAQVDKRISLNNILFLTDFSATSERALPFLSEIAREYGAKVTALYILVPDVLAYMTPDSLSAAIELQKESVLAEMRRVETQLTSVPNKTVVIGGKEVWGALESMQTSAFEQMKRLLAPVSAAANKEEMGRPSLKITREEGCEPPTKLEYKPGQPIESLCSAPARSVNGLQKSVRQ